MLRMIIRDLLDGTPFEYLCCEVDTGDMTMKKRVRILFREGQIRATMPSKYIRSTNKKVNSLVTLSTRNLHKGVI